MFQSFPTECLEALQQKPHSSRDGKRGNPALRDEETKVDGSSLSQTLSIIHLGPSFIFLPSTAAFRPSLSISAPSFTLVTPRVYGVDPVEKVI